MLSLAVVLFWMSLRKVPYTGRLLLLGVGLVVVLVLSYPPLQERLATIFSPQNASTEVRFDEYRMFPRPSPAIRWESASRSTRRCRAPTSWASPTCG